MNNLVTLITPTGGRPECFALCEELIKRQTYKGPFQWVVIDDCTPVTKLTHPNQEYYRGPREWEPKLNTQRGNMELAVSLVRGDYIFIIEDDEYYAPTYIEEMLNLLKHSQITGVGESRYYHVGIPGHITMPNFGHGSLSQTAFKKSILPLLKDAINSGEMYFDIYLWRKVKEQKLPWTLLHNTNISVGIKGMPGRLGVTPSHTTKKYYHDSGYNKLKSWIGDDIKYYLPFLRKRKLLESKK